MASQSARMVIAPSGSTLEDASLHLMPFNIAYSGPAPLSTFWKVRDAPEPTTSSTKNDEVLAETQGEDSQDTLVGKDQVDTPKEEEKMDATLVELPLAKSKDALDATLVEPGETTLEKAKKMFVSAFRGRRMFGTRVDLPAGYSGFVLSAPGVAESKEEVAGKKRKRDVKDVAEKVSKKVKEVVGGRATRGRSAAAQKAAPAEIEVEVVDDDGDGDVVMADAKTGDTQDGMLRELVPTAAFSSFMLWHSDRAVDEKNDEYVRALDEWIRMSTLIHSV